MRWREGRAFHYDVHGNVCEWVADWFDPAYYGVSPSIDPTGPATPPASEPLATRVIRGGSWLHNETFARSARRNQRTPASRLWYVGFRVLRQIE